MRAIYRSSACSVGTKWLFLHHSRCVSSVQTTLIPIVILSSQWGSIHEGTGQLTQSSVRYIYIVTGRRGSRKLGMQKCLAQDNNAWYLVRTLHYALCLFHASTNASRKIRTLSSQTHGIFYMEALCTHAKKCLLTFTKAQSTFLGKL